MEAFFFYFANIIGTSQSKWRGARWWYTWRTLRRGETPTSCLHCSDEILFSCWRRKEVHYTSVRVSVYVHAFGVKASTREKEREKLIERRKRKKKRKKKKENMKEMII